MQLYNTIYMFAKLVVDQRWVLELWSALCASNLLVYKIMHTFATVRIALFYKTRSWSMLSLVRIVSALCASKDMICNSLPGLCVCSTILPICNISATLLCEWVMCVFATVYLGCVCVPLFCCISQTWPNLWLKSFKQREPNSW